MNTTIQGRVVEFGQDSSILINGKRLRAYLLAHRCPFCARGIGWNAARYSCDCDGWQALEDATLIAHLHRSAPVCHSEHQVPLF